MKFERYLTQYDAAILGRLAEQMLRVRELKFNAGEELVDLISSSILLPATVTKPDHVSLFSEVTCSKVGSGETFTVVIVSPEDANQTLAQISILSPIGLALIGRKINSTVEVRLPFGQTETIKIIGIEALSTSTAAVPAA
ncbi:regulator of nucleoside diphosphate kinase [Paucimonas lemoignei]|uniref:Regulator of nucleoside diphosphate kinase n=1 Tax=Paucimonas lemoignei TaxID=29443 RepID=A0A4R3HYH0_PAULE|nr:GreA/GreB family elongation factor [Paucimonas lemoignei]TCS36529.1 regulator of nucleoside diphosphate kinase [Paucimonas lemoignei]